MINYIKIGERYTLDDGTVVVAVAQNDYEGCGDCLLNTKEYQHLCPDFLCGKHGRFDNTSVNFRKI